MDCSEEDIEKAISILSNKHRTPIIRHVSGYIVLAYTEFDYETKKNRILRGDTFGFYSVKKIIE